MKLQAQSSKALNAALQKSMKCTNAKNSLAILSHVLIQQRGKDQFFFTSSTGDSQLTIPAPLTVVGGTFSKPIAVSPDLLSAFLSTLEDCTVTFDFADDGNALTASYCTTVGEKVKEGKVSLTYEDGAEFPFMSELKEDALHISLPMAAFAGVTATATNFTSKEELRPQMQSLAIDVAEDLSDVVFVATNGHNLIKTVYSNDPKRGGGDFFRSGKAQLVMLHSAYFRALSAFEDCETVEIESDETKIRISTGDNELICKRIEGRYPNYNAVVPKSNPFYVSFNKKEMLAVLKRISLFGDTASNLVVLKKDGMFLNVSAENVDFARGAEDQVVLLDAQCQEGFRVGLSSKSLGDCINAINADTLRMQLSDPSRPAVLTADEPAPASLAMCMPMIIE